MNPAYFIVACITFMFACSVSVIPCLLWSTYNRHDTTTEKAALLFALAGSGLAAIMLHVATGCSIVLAFRG